MTFLWAHRFTKVCLDFTICTVECHWSVQVSGAFSWEPMRVGLDELYTWSWEEKLQIFTKSTGESDWREMDGSGKEIDSLPSSTDPHFPSALCDLASLLAPLCVDLWQCLPLPGHKGCPVHYCPSALGWVYSIMLRVPKSRQGGMKQKMSLKSRKMVIMFFCGEKEKRRKGEGNKSDILKMEWCCSPWKFW